MYAKAVAKYETVGIQRCNRTVYFVGEKTVKKEVHMVADWHKNCFFIDVVL